MQILFWLTRGGVRGGLKVLLKCVLNKSFCKETQNYRFFILNLKNIDIEFIIHENSGLKLFYFYKCGLSSIMETVSNYSFQIF